jgi:high-affinity nickel-transport protein
MRTFIRLSIILGCMNAAAWTAAFALLGHHPLQLSAALLAYMLGLRHAVDADHIAAIDTATRKLIQQRRPSESTGLFFALGHSTIVILFLVTIALTGKLLGFFDHALIASMSRLGSLMSILFLLVLSSTNLALFASALKRHRRARGGELLGTADADDPLQGNGLLTRLTRALFKLVSRPSQMYWVGLLFGLGFDTASEIALLGLSASGAAGAAASWTILVYPALFASAMSLVDTADSVLMARAFRWAETNPARRASYNLILTGASAMFALTIATVEVVDLF